MDSIRKKYIQVSTQYKKLDEIYYLIAKELGLSETSFWVLYTLCESDEVLTQNSIRERLGIPKQTINSAITNLSKDGFLYLEQLNLRGNSKGVILTEKGREYCSKNILPILKTEDEAYSNIDKNELEVFFKLYEAQNNLLSVYLSEYLKSVKEDGI